MSSAVPENAVPGPLHGVRVVDLSTVVMGPYAAQILGDLGADVIKIESPKDTARLGNYARSPGMTPLALNVNRNKRSVDFNLKDAADREQALKLIDTADVLITNMRPGALDRLGLDYDSLAQRCPRLIYAHAQGFRADSDRAGNAAYDETIQAASGLVDITYRATGQTTYLPTIIADKVSSLTIAYSVLAALVHQRASGHGQYIEIPMADTLIAFNFVEHLSGQSFQPALGPTGYPLAMTPMHRAVHTADGLACVIPYSPQNFRDLFIAAGRPELAEDPRVNGRSINTNDVNELQALIELCTPALTTEQWAQVCAKHSIPMAPVLEIQHAHEDPYVQQGHLLDVLEHPTEGPLRTIGIPVRFSRTPASIRSLAARPGEHTAEIVAELAEGARS